VQPAARQVAEKMKNNLREPVKQAVEVHVTDEAHATTDDVTACPRVQHNLSSPSSE